MEKGKRALKKIVESNSAYYSNKQMTRPQSDVFSQKNPSNKITNTKSEKYINDWKCEKEENENNLLKLESKMGMGNKDGQYEKNRYEKENNEQEFELALVSNSSKIQHLEVKSSIDSNRKIKSNTSRSIPLSDLILTDLGYEHLFEIQQNTSRNITFLQENYHRNVEELNQQLKEMISFTEMEIMLKEEQEIRQKMLHCENQIRRMRQLLFPKNKTPIKEQIKSWRNLCSPQRNSSRLNEELAKERYKSQRLSAKLLQAHHYCQAFSRKNHPTQYDFNIATIPSAPVTPISNQKLMLPNKTTSQSEISQYYCILTEKKQMVVSSIETMESYFNRKQKQLKQENRILEKEIDFLNKLIANPYEDRNQCHKSRSNKHRMTEINYYYDISLSRNKLSSPQRVFAQSKSPTQNQKIRRLFRPNQISKKQKLIQLISVCKNQVKTQPSDDYCISKNEGKFHKY